MNKKYYTKKPNSEYTWANNNDFIMPIPNKQFKIEKLKEASEIKAMLKFYNKRTN